MKIASVERVMYPNCILFFWHSEQFMYTKCTELAILMQWTCNSMNNLLSYCGFVDPRISASEKDLPVHSELQPENESEYQSSDDSGSRRACGHVDEGTCPHQVLAANLTLSQPGGADYALSLLVSTPSFESHRRAWVKSRSELRAALS